MSKFIFLTIFLNLLGFSIAHGSVDIRCANEKLRLELSDSGANAIFYDSRGEVITKYLLIDKTDFYVADFNPENGVYFATYYQDSLSTNERFFSLSGTGVYKWGKQKFEASIHSPSDPISFKDYQLKSYLDANQVSVAMNCEILKD